VDSRNKGVLACLRILYSGKPGLSVVASLYVDIRGALVCTYIDTGAWPVQEVRAYACVMIIGTDQLYLGVFKGAALFT
jgi:hypothetical protein